MDNVTEQAPVQASPQEPQLEPIPEVDLAQQEAELDRQIEANQKMIETLQKEIFNYAKLNKVGLTTPEFAKPPQSEGVLSDPNAFQGGGKQDPFIQNQDGKITVNLNNEAISGKAIEGSDGSFMDNLRFGAESFISGVGSGGLNLAGEALEGISALGESLSPTRPLVDALTGNDKNPSLEVLPATEADNIPFTLTDTITRFVVASRLGNYGLSQFKLFQPGAVGTVAPWLDKGVNSVKEFGKLTTLSGLSQYLAFDKNDGNLSNLAAEHLSNYYLDFGETYMDLGVLKNPVTEFLMAKTTDSEVLGRLKGVLENGGMDTILASTFTAGALVFKRTNLLEQMFGKEAATKYLSNVDNDKIISMLFNKNPIKNTTKEGPTSVTSQGGKTTLGAQLEHTNYNYNKYSDGTVTPVSPTELDGGPSAAKFDSTSEVHHVNYTKQGPKSAAASAKVIQKATKLKQAQQNLKSIKADEKSLQAYQELEALYEDMLASYKPVLQEETVKSAQTSASVMEYYAKFEDDYFNVLQEVRDKGFELRGGPNSFEARIQEIQSRIGRVTDPQTKNKLNRQITRINDLRERYGTALKNLKSAEEDALTNPSLGDEFSKRVGEPFSPPPEIQEAMDGMAKLREKFAKLNQKYNGVDNIGRKAEGAESAVQKLQQEFDNFTKTINEYKPQETTVIKGEVQGTPPVKPPKPHEVEKFLSGAKNVNTDVFKRQLRQMNKEEFSNFFNQLDDAGKKRLKKLTGC